MHVEEESLLAVSCARGDLGVLTESARAHLAECTVCRTRIEAATGVLGGWTDAAVAEADAQFSVERLAHQREAVMRKLALAGQPACVIAFPSRGARGPAGHGVARRWVAAAAVAGLCVGLLTGRALGPFSGSPARPGLATAQSRRSAVGEPLFAPSVRQATALGDPDEVDEAFLHELDLAVMAPRIAPLATLDALTPHQPDTGPR